MTETVREAIIRIAGAPDVPEALTLFECMTFTPEGRAILDAIIYNTCPTCGGEGRVNDDTREPGEHAWKPCPDCADDTHIISAELREKACEVAMDKLGYIGPWDELAPLYRGWINAAVDTVLSTVFPGVRVFVKDKEAGK